MKSEIERLKEEFEQIKNRGWILEKTKGKGSCGILFEELLNKMEDNFPVPDYHNIEIKTMNDNTKTNLHLFCLTPDGDYLFPIKRVLKEIGYPCGDRRMFHAIFNTNDYTKLMFGRKGKIVVNYKEDKVELIVYNHLNENINIGISWSFDYLKKRLEMKLQYLAFVRVASCIINGKGYYRYHTISFYKLKSFDEFIRLIDQGIIDISFKIDTYNSGKRIGEVHDHGTDFSIKVSDINLLYDLIEL